MSIFQTVMDAAIQSFQYDKILAERAIQQVSDSKMHESLDPETNSVVVIMKHVAGNLKSRWTDFLTSDGEKPWRDRDSEFIDDFSSRSELIAFWESGWRCLFEALASLKEDDFTKIVKIRGYEHSVPLAISRSSAHIAYHVGQIVMIARVHVGADWETLTIDRGKSEQFNKENWGP